MTYQHPFASDPDAADPNASDPELWAGIECTVNRVNDLYHDQQEYNGHAARSEDLDLFARLGIRGLRYPLLWERTAPEGLETIDWSRARTDLTRLRELDIQPIVGLVHHGSGPRHTSLISPSFAEGLAQYAGQVAEQFPWIEDWTPVNEPLTTARFSGLYGHWYPHGNDEQTFARALVTQCRAVALAMQSVRRVNPAARLVQTDDLGKVYSTPRLQYQADFENERRWLSWDLLSGLVDRYHRMWWHLLWTGIEERELQWFLENPCPPDMLGVNHYLTSERYLDEHTERYPALCYGDNGRDRYADVEAVRVLPMILPGIKGILSEAWTRYKRPIAITEVHLGCTREEQMRWLLEVWNSAKECRHKGMDIRAVTVWALLGSYDWNSLLTRREGHYEPGVFDLRGAAPRPTALAGLMRELADGVEPQHPILATPGWWRRSKRLLYSQPEPYPELSGLASLNDAPFEEHAAPARPLLITGAGGTLGYAFARLCDHRGLAHVALTRQELDITDPASIQAALARYEPWAVINAAGFRDVDRAEQETERCFQENTSGPALLATECAMRGLPLLTFSSAMVFNGRQQTPYLESDSLTPKNTYGKSQAKAEKLVQEIWPSTLIARSSAFFGPWDADNFVTVALKELAAGRRVVAANDIHMSPTYVPDLVHACLDLLLDGASGVWHLTNAGSVTWADFIRQAAEQAGLNTELIEEVPMRVLQLAAARPVYSVLASERGQLLPPVENGLACYFKDHGASWESPDAAEPAEHEPRPGIHQGAHGLRFPLRNRPFRISRTSGSSSQRPRHRPEGYCRPPHS